MKKVKLFFLFGVLAVTLYSCSQMNAQKYNDAVTGLYKNYTDKLTKDIEEVLNENTTKENSNVTIKHIETLTDSCLGVMNGLKPMEEAKQFHEKVIAVFNGVKSSFIPDAKKLIALKGAGNVAANVDEYNKLIEHINTTQTQLEKLESEAIKAQEDFAKKLGRELQ